MTEELYGVSKAGLDLDKINYLEQISISYTKPSVVIYNSNGWFSSFLVDGKTIVETVDIYTYQCQSCANNMNCLHVNAVDDFVIQEMDIFSQWHHMYHELIPKMKGEIDKFKQYMDLYFNTEVMKTQVLEMRFVIKKLRDVVNKI
ncbi:hypothetical protein Klosneuvirus_3_238 [Klosneuvirus KNV1]|uniref:Uncharacterized protein n=1 Tax=Klosneuvirus KNV1 TaxID=1977640 RepID=A0A1V0SK67_9VIRU|nr:hypothetical protein Klosneuvirus_3_238 [Klosneuvirus KNV1]